MKKNIIRSSVYIGVNNAYGVYEVTDKPGVYIVNLCQKESWYEKDKLYEIVKTVPWTTELCGLKRGFVMPGNILMALSTEQITEDPEEHLYYMEDGSIAHDIHGNAIYGYFYFNPQSPHQPVGELQDQDCIDILMGISEINELEDE